MDTVANLDAAMKALILNSKKELLKNKDCNKFLVDNLKTILAGMLSFNKVNKHLFARFQNYTQHQDILDFCWQIIPELTPKSVALNNTTFVENLFELITAALPTSIKDEPNNEKCIIYTDAEAEPQVWQYNYGTIVRNINQTWYCIMQWNIQNEDILRQILILLLEKLMPHILKPLLLTDFFMESLEAGGPISLLGLQGIFILIQYHNLTCPDIYDKLYGMFQPEIFHTKFKARLFYLADIFLTSSHLPQGLVAAFVKRLARLSLIAPPSDIIIIIQFIANLIIRHKGLKIFLNHPTGGSVMSDPYLQNESVPTKSNALESSLWEIAAMQNHALPSIASAAKSIFNSLPSHEVEIGTLLEATDDELFEAEANKKFKIFPVNFETSDGLYLKENDRLKKYWNLF